MTVLGDRLEGVPWLRKALNAAERRGAAGEINKFRTDAAIVGDSRSLWQSRAVTASPDEHESDSIACHAADAVR